MEAGRNGTETRKKILNYMTDYFKLHGYCPSIREIGAAVGLRSTSTVQSHLTIMLNRGMIETDEKPGASRAIRVPGWKFVKEEQR